MRGFSFPWRAPPWESGVTSSGSSSSIFQPPAVEVINWLFLESFNAPGNNAANFFKTMQGVNSPKPSVCKAAEKWATVVQDKEQ
ncbi:hypothetical protein CEXT_125851 [Caerostris extrusa]|uniref:Uncharacterized protein n=1 Tax=Caerostris extrusa TaxID=172846 RepID=A0AAV4QN34_CAEEX|nr:hypothetical protein CEXT_125851 [Caerostris extrusa]